MSAQSTEARAPVEPESPPEDAAAAAAADSSPNPMRAGVSRVRARITRARGWATHLRVIRWALGIATSLHLDDPGSGSLAGARPPALAELWAYTKAGDWVPGDRHPFLEAAGRVYGYGVAVPVSAVLYGLAWLLQRPTRLAVAVAVVLVFEVTR